jgi:hypothetical protein
MDFWPEVAEISSSVQENDSVFRQKAFESVAVKVVQCRGVHNPMSECGKSEVFAFPDRGISGVRVPRKVK